MHKFVDWKGNEIKDGMTIYFVRTKPMLTGKIGMYVPRGGGEYDVITESDEAYEKRMSEEFWELGPPYEVTEREGKLYITLHYNNDPDIDSISMPLWTKEQENSIVAIKGISDKKE